MLAIYAAMSGPPPLTFGRGVNQMLLSWPANYTGWILEVQTNSLASGLCAHWTSVAGSTDTNQWLFPLGTVNESVFFRLHSP